MSAVREKAQGYTKQIVGQMIGDGQLVQEGKEQQEHAEDQGGKSSPPEPSDTPPDAAPRKRRER